jgi:hypothetical protein
VSDPDTAEQRPPPGLEGQTRRDDATERTGNPIAARCGEAR